MNPLDPQPVKAGSLRRSQRVCLRMGVVVVRKDPGKTQSSEETHTLIVNAHGALILLSMSVQIGHALTLKNVKTQEELSCRVVHIGSHQSGKTEVGIQFDQPAPRFWRIAFPPPDWSPRSPEAKSATPQIARQQRAAEVPRSGSPQADASRRPR